MKSHYSTSDRLLAVTLRITGTELGDFRMVSTRAHSDEAFNKVILKEGVEPVFTVTPEPTTAGLLGVGALRVFRLTLGRELDAA